MNKYFTRSMISKHSIFFSFCFLAHIISSYAQTLNFNQYGVEEGLSQSSIYTLQQDSAGMIWMGTMHGINTYNGKKFESYTRKDGLAENRVTSSLIDKDGHNWFGHWSGGITKYDCKKKKFEEIIPSNNPCTKSIFSIHQDKNGIIWFATEGEGILKLENGIFSSITHKDGLVSDVVYAITSDKEGTLVAGTVNGAVRLKGNKNFEPIESTKHLCIRSLLFDKKNNLWIGTMDKGLIKISHENKITNYTTANGLANNYVRVLFEDALSTIFIGTYGGGVSKYLPQLEENHYTENIFRTISTKQGLSNDKVLSIIQDREKNIWIGTYLNLNQYFDEQFEIYGQNEGLHNNLVWSIIESRNNKFWIGTEGGLFEAIPYSNKTSGNGSSSLQFTFNKVIGKPNELLNTSALYEDVKGNVWFTHFGRGLFRYNPSTKQTTTYNVENNQLPVNEIYSIAGDKNGNIWIGTNKGGLIIFDIASEKFSRFTTADGIGSNQIYAIYRDSKNRMWLGTLSGSLTLYDQASTPSLNSKKETTGFKQLSDKDGYPSNFTLCITEDVQHNLWFGTYDLGIYRYNEKQFKNFSTKDGLSSNTPFLLVADNYNNLWIGTGLGVDRFNLKDERFKHYERADGFLGIEINPNACYKDKNGCLWFGSIIGLVRYHSQNEKNNLIEPILTIHNPRIFFREAETPADHVYGWNQNHLTFDFLGSSLTNPKRVKYQYQLVGLDEEKSPVIKETSVTYPALHPGKYVFKVWSCNNDGIWIKEPAMYEFSINPPFWKTTWFWMLVALIVITACVTYVKWRERILRKENAILEQKVIERTETIHKQKQELENKNQKITDSINYAKRIQDSIFISKKEMKAYPFEWFLFFQPKDIVSGDFYWSYKLGNKIWIAIADCTGHGVPGAFMSLIGYNLLNQTIKEMGIYQPSEILNQLRKLMKETFSSEKASEVKDGMTISLICMDTHSNYIEYAGSYNNLYLYRNNLLSEYKSNKIPIGNSAVDFENTEFTNHGIQLQKGDTIYLFSDGYPDQIGGEHQKKFYYSSFQELLGSIYTLPTLEQKSKINEALVQWMNGREQIDDISILGMKF